MYTEMTRWTYSWINIRTVLGRIQSLLLVRPYQANNQVNNQVVQIEGVVGSQLNNYCVYYCLRLRDEEYVKIWLLFALLNKYLSHVADCTDCSY